MERKGRKDKKTGLRLAGTVKRKERKERKEG